jgi:hypothetical protein
MKNFINVLVIIILTGFAIGTTWICYHDTNENSMWAVLYLPLFIFMVAWGIKLDKDYKNK